MKPPNVIEPVAVAPDWRQHFTALARYHVWALNGLYACVDLLTDAHYRADVGLFFKSVHGTLNHLLVAEHHVWFPRFAEGISNRVALNDEVEPDRAALRQRLIAAAARWQPLVERWSDAHFAGRIDYTSTSGIAHSLPFALTLAHVFNHGTHHRGQISAAITAMGQEGPELDLVRMLQLEGQDK